IQNAGQTCSAGSRLLVHRDVHAEVVDKLAAAMSEVTIGYGLDDPLLGPLISAEQHERVSGFLSEVETGQIVTGDRRPVELADDLAAGAFIRANLGYSGRPQARLAQE